MVLLFHSNLRGSGMRLSDKKDRILICFNDQQGIGVSVIKE